MTTFNDLTISDDADVAPKETAFWDCSLTKFEIVILLTALCITGGLQLDPVLNSSLALPLIGVMAFLCWLTPVTSFFYIAASQSLPFPPESSLNPAMIGAIVWVVVFPFRHGLPRWRTISLLLLLAVPWLTWYCVFGQIDPTDHLKALAYGMIACFTADKAGDRLLKCLLGLCLGGLTVALAYWARLGGLPVVLINTAGERGGEARLGGARTDAVAFWPGALMGLAGILGLSALSTARHTFPRQALVLTWLVIAAFLFVVPPLAATVTNSAYFGLALILFLYVAFMLPMVARTGRLRRLSPLLFAIVVAFCGFLYLFVTNTFDIRDKVLATLTSYSQASETTGSAASRTDAWQTSVRTIATYPLFGPAFAGQLEELPTEYQGYGSYGSHNIFLDSGRAGGIPCLLLALVFAFYPPYKLLRSAERFRYMPLLLAYVGGIITWMVLSYTGYKTIWAIWALMAVCLLREKETSAVAD
jgi:O-antigen ligase